VRTQRLGVHEQLWRTLSSTNPIESMIAICRSTSRNVKRWQNGDMCLRWTAVGMLEAERQFRKIIRLEAGGGSGAQRREALSR
jgi:hypothetical protein